MLGDKGSVHKSNKIVMFPKRKAAEMDAAETRSAESGLPNALPAFSNEPVKLAPKGATDLTRIAISVEGDRVSQQFGGCEKFCIVNISKQEIISRQFVNNPILMPDFMPEFLALEFVDCVVTGCINERENEMLNANAIDVITGAEGLVEEVIASFIKEGLRTKNKNHNCLKIAIPVDCMSEETKVCMSFGRTP